MTAESLLKSLAEAIPSESIPRILLEIEAVDVNSLEDGWQLHLSYSIRQAWPQLSLEQKTVAYLMASESASYSLG